MYSAPPSLPPRGPRWWRDLWRSPRHHPDDWRGLILVLGASVAMLIWLKESLLARTPIGLAIALGLAGLVAGQAAEVLPIAWRRPPGVLRVLLWAAAVAAGMLGS